MRKVIWQPLGITVAVCGIMAGVAFLRLEANPRDAGIAAHAGNENFTTIDRPGAEFTLLWGINPQGEIVGTSGNGAAFHGGSLRHNWSTRLFFWRLSLIPGESNSTQNT
jgi:hypothetical protein